MSTGITVPGMGVATRIPDAARVLVGVEVAAATAGAAQSGASAAMAAVTAALREAGVAPSDLATASIALAPTMDYAGPTPRMTGYGASQSLAVRVRSLDRLGELIDRAIAAGATIVHEVSLEVSEPAEALAEARERAMADARARADALARLAGVSLGRAVSIVEGPRHGRPIPMAKAARMELAMDASTPVEAGTTELTVEVEVTFAILG
jgi:uncharacterized protein YggE